MTLDYFYGAQADLFTFYRIPKALFTEERFKPISAEAKILYGILLDRMSLSQRNGWLDEDNRVFIIFTLDEVMDAIGCADQKATKLLSELENKAGLIERKRQGLGKPNLIYVKNFVDNPVGSPDGTQESRIKSRENHDSGTVKITNPESRKSQSNNTEINNTDFSETDTYPFPSAQNADHGRDSQDRMRADMDERQRYRDLLERNLEYDILMLNHQYDQDTIEEIMELMLDTICSKRQYIRIAGDDKPREVVKSQLLKLNSEHIEYKAIMQYILHYTKPGDLVLDGFCGTGMTGVAAQMCGCPDNDFKYKMEHLNPDVIWGARKAILNDLSPSATFIAANYNASIDGFEFSNEVRRIVDEAERELGWMYHTKPKEENIIGGQAVINYTLWSDVFYCPHCGKEIVFWDIAIDEEGNMRKELRCNSCGSIIKKTQCLRAKEITIDKVTGNTIEFSKQVPVLINYTYGGKRYDKKPDAQDIGLIEKIKEMDTARWYPTTEIPYGEKTSDPIKAGFTRVNLYYTERNLYALALIWDKAQKSKYKNQIMFCVTAILMKTASKLHNVGMKKGKINLAGAMPNALYIPSILAERNIFTLVRGKIKDIEPVFSFSKETGNCCVSCGSSTDLHMIPNNSI